MKVAILLSMLVSMFSVNAHALRVDDGSGQICHLERSYQCVAWNDHKECFPNRAGRLICRAVSDCAQYKLVVKKVCE